MEAKAHLVTFLPRAAAAVAVAEQQTHWSELPVQWAGPVVVARQAEAGVR
jgi:hypothetical protein